MPNDASAGRSIADYEFKFSSNEPDGTFEGYGSVFNVEDSNGDLILPHAFDETLATHRRAGSLPKMLINHGMGSGGIGVNARDMIPIGKWTKMSADSHGLQTKGRLINLDTELGKQIYGAMKEGELSGLSIGYIARDFTRGTAPNEPRRTMKTVELFEVSPVTFPGNVHAGINQVKTRLPLIDFDPRDMEDALRDAGLSQRERKSAVAVFRKMLRRDAGEPGTEPCDEAAAAETVAAMTRLAERIRALA